MCIACCYSKNPYIRAQQCGSTALGVSSYCSCLFFIGGIQQRYDVNVVFRKEISASATDIICIDGKAMRGTLYENGHNPDIVSAYSLGSGFTLTTNACKKENEIKYVPRLLDKLYVPGCVATADTVSFPKIIIAKIREKEADFVIELKANQKYLRYGPEDSIKTAILTDVYKESPYLEHGRIESRIYRGEELIANKEK